MKKHYETHVEDTDKLISVAGPVLDYKSWYEQYRKLMEEQAQRKYGLYTPTSEGDDDDFPSITGMIARYSALGLTNEQMATNPVWVDKTGNGHDLQMKDFAWAGMSGVGGYKYNFLSNDWSADVNQLSVALSHKIVVINKRTSIQLFKWIRNELENTINITLKITGLEANGSSFKIYDNVGSSHAQEYNKDGIYEIDYTANEGANKIYFYVIGGNIGQLENPITIEQLPLYPGALVFDGVDDYGVCDNFPILTKEKGYTVVALRQWLAPETKTINEVLLGNFKNNPIWISANLGAFQFEVKYNVSKKVQTDSFGIGNNITLNNNHLFSYQISNSYNGSILRLGSNVGGNFFTVGCGGDQFYANAVIWELVFLDHDATEEELTKIKDYFVKTYPWLFPDQAWTVTGKTNEDEDRATIANITGNGNDLVLSNLGFIEGSGYNEEGEYAGYLVTDGVDDKIVSSFFGMGKDFTIVGDWKFIGNKKSGTGLVKGSSFYIYNTMIGLDLYINSGSVKNSLDGIKSINAACSDGRAYDRNWNEILANTGNVVGSGGPLEVSSSGGRFDRIAFKNLAIYPRILSKDDCIKAYNYLQTLKAK